jgi:hypothetical protein
MSIWLFQMCASTALENALSITLSLGEYLQALRLARMSVNAATTEPLVLEGMAQTRMAFRSYMYATNIYCMLWKDLIGKAQVSSVYIAPVCKFANVAKQNMLWTEHSCLVGWM